METTRALFAQEIEARGEANGINITTQVIKLFMQKTSPADISNEMGMPLAKVNAILVDSGLIDLPQ